MKNEVTLALILSIVFSPIAAWSLEVKIYSFNQNLFDNAESYEYIDHYMLSGRLSLQNEIDSRATSTYFSLKNKLHALNHGSVQTGTDELHNENISPPKDQGIDLKVNEDTNEVSMSDKSESNGLTVRQKFWLVNGIVIAPIITYGLAAWWHDYRSMWFVDEGWFGKNSSAGGADKLGHAYSTYVSSRFLSNAYRRIGIDDASADWKGALAGWSFTSLVEVADAFHQFGFSVGDLIANASGSLLAFAEERYSNIDDLIDFRMEYWPSKGYRESGGADILTDYSGMKHLLVFKLSGIKELEHSLLSYLEFHAGYFTRGYKSYDKGHFDEKTRNLYVGLSINLSKIFEIAGNKSTKVKKPLHYTSTFLEYYQIPNLYIDAVKTYE